LLIEKEVRSFIKTDAKVSIISDGLMGDKVLIISSGTSTQNSVKIMILLPQKVPLK
jgi:phospholipid/cholesterol/gamma-HCH transport system substrate-binding protein